MGKSDRGNFLGEKMRKTFLSIMAAIMTAVILFTVIPIASNNVEAAGVRYKRGTYGVPDDNYKNRGTVFFPEGSTNGSCRALIYIHGASGDEELLKDFESYLNKFYGCFPECEQYVIIVPHLVKYGNGKYSETDFMEFINGGHLDKLYSSILNHTFRQVDTSKSVMIAGHSMGGSAALAAASKYWWRFDTVGALSPSMHFCNDFATNVFYRTSDIPNIGLSNYSSSTYFISYGKNEDSQFWANADRYFDIVERQAPNSLSVLYEWNLGGYAHGWPLFQRELFSFMYFVNHKNTNAKPVPDDTKNWIETIGKR